MLMRRGRYERKQQAYYRLKHSESTTLAQHHFCLSTYSFSDHFISFALFRENSSFYLLTFKNCFSVILLCHTLQLQHASLSQASITLKLTSVALLEQPSNQNPIAPLSVCPRLIVFLEVASVLNSQLTRRLAVQIPSRAKRRFKHFSCLCFIGAIQRTQL